LDDTAISAFTLGTFFGVESKQLRQQYKDHVSDYRSWNQREHAAERILYEANRGKQLSIDEPSLSNGGLFTILTDKAAKGCKGPLVAMIRGTSADQIATVLERIPESVRRRVEEVTLDMAGAMKRAVRRIFPEASLVSLSCAAAGF
jgi:transposase